MIPGRRYRQRTMSLVTCHMSISLDGYVAGPDQGPDDPVGVGGLRLHEWHWHADQPGHEADRAMRDEIMKDRGAYVMGRNMFGPIRGEWDGDWRGWWGEDPPFHCPVYVLTHHPRDPFELDGGNSFHFVTDGIEKAMAEAREAADDEDVTVGGGASTLQQAIAAGSLDEIVVHQVPIFLGGGERLFDHLAAGAAKVDLVDVVEGADALHLTYRLG